MADIYGMTIKGNCEVGTDNSYRMGDVATRFSNIYSVYFTGIATSAEYADLAEKYTCPEDLPIGTVISVSRREDFEVDACRIDCDPACIGVVSEKPAYLMNSALQGGLITGLVGRVPVKINGSIAKGDFIVPTSGGCARRGNDGEESHKMGVCMETKEDENVKLVLCIIK
jgi:hypothetical protein